MANQNDSFIDEVTEELRRDRLYGAFRRYGWIAVAIILLVVGGTAWREYSRAQERQAAQAWGDAVLAAEEAGDAGAILAIDSSGRAERAALGQLMAASVALDSGETETAIAALTQASTAPGVLGELAQLKLVLHQGAAMDPSERDAVLTHLSRSGAPFELLALEQKAVALVGAGRAGDALILIEQILQKPALSQALRQRLSEMMIALGTDPADLRVLDDGAMN